MRLPVPMLLNAMTCFPCRIFTVLLNFVLRSAGWFLDGAHQVLTSTDLISAAQWQPTPNLHFDVLCDSVMHREDSQCYRDAMY